MAAASPENNRPQADALWDQTLKASLNILEDFQDEKMYARESTQAVLNILADFEDEKSGLNQTNRAMLNILDDFEVEKGVSLQMNRAVVNILEDLEEEKALTAKLNGQLEQRVLKRTAELAHSEERFRLLVDGVKDCAIIMLDPEGFVLTWNAGAERLKGYRADEIVGQDFGRFYTPEDRASGKPRRELQHALQHGSYEEEGPRIRKDGSQFVASILITPVGEEGGQHIGFAKVTRDITERKRAEDQVRQLNQDLEQRVQQRTADLAAANKELEAFSYSVSHDLRAPLRAIDGFSRILMDDFGAHLPADAQTYLHDVRANTKHMGHLVDDLLSFSRLSRQALKKQTVATGALVRQCLDELGEAQKGRRVDLRIGDLPPCQADPALLKQVWLNLLGNALKYTGKRATAVIEVGCNSGGAQVFFVKDNGVGFDMRYVHKLFGVFQRLHRAEDYEGTGVGLAIVQRIVQRHGGKIWAEAQPERGATFSFTLAAGESP